MDAADRLAKLESYTNIVDSLILVILPDSSYSDFNLEAYFVEIMKQSFSKSTFTLLKRVSIWMKFNCESKSSVIIITLSLFTETWP